MKESCVSESPAASTDSTNAANTVGEAALALTALATPLEALRGSSTTERGVATTEVEECWPVRVIRAYSNPVTRRRSWQSVAIEAGVMWRPVTTEAPGRVEGSRVGHYGSVVTRSST